MAGQSDGLYFYLVAVFFVCPSAAASNLVCKVAAQRTLRSRVLSLFFSHYFSSCPFPFLLQSPVTDCWVSSTTDNTSSSLLLSTHHDSIHSLTVAVVIKRPSPAFLAACTFSPFSGATLNLSAWHDPWHWRHSPPLVFWSSGDEDAAADIVS